MRACCSPNSSTAHGHCRLATPIIANKPLHLASSSPRRREILAALGLDFTVGGADVDERRQGTVMKELFPLGEVFA